jgi:mono/diheme cytochrome c family protein
MKKALKVASLVSCSVVAGAFLVIATYQPAQRPASTASIEATPAQKARGRYLVDHVVACTVCHSQRDDGRFAGPVVGTPGAGAPCAGEELGFPGTVCFPNITPDPTVGIGAWSDGEILRAMREGVDRQGRGLFPGMPYHAYRGLSDADAEAIVVHLRSLEPSPNEPAGETDIDFPVNFFVKLIPEPLDGPVAGPDDGDDVARGRYLSEMAGCSFCHTPVDDRKQPLLGREMAGGHVHLATFGSVVAPNLTPHATGLTMTRAAFVSLFKSFGAPEAAAKVDPQDNTVMPWLRYAGMTEDDLGSIFAYLSSVPPIDHVVERRPRRAEVADASP